MVHTIDQGGTSFALDTFSVIVSTSRALELKSTGRVVGKFGTG
jgi:hypothetical protein